MVPVVPESRSHGLSVVFAKDQPQYNQLPANILGAYVETKWKLTWRERWNALVSGNIYLTLKTFREKLQPIRMSLLRAEDDVFGICNRCPHPTKEDFQQYHSF